MMRKAPPPLARKLADAAQSFAATFDDMRMDDIAQASGIPRATLYYYFDGKDDILAFLLNTLLEELRVNLSASIRHGGSAKDLLCGLTQIQLTYLAAYPSAAQLLLANLGKAGKLPDLASSVQEIFLAPIEEILRDAIERGEIRDRDLGGTATALFGAVSVVGLQTLVLNGHLDTEAVAAQLIDLFWTGLAAGNLIDRC
jgi:AcrR family transcriptional regulator